MIAVLSREQMRAFDMDTGGVQVDPERPTGAVQVRVEDGAVDFRHRLRQRVDLDAFVGRLLGRQSHVRKLR